MGDEARETPWRRVRPAIGASLGLTVMAGGLAIASVAVWTIPLECFEIANRVPRPDRIGFPRSLGVGFFGIVVTPAALLLAGLAKLCSPSPWAVRTASIGLGALSVTAVVAAAGYAFLGAGLGIELR